MFKSGLGDHIYWIEHNWRTKCINNFKEIPKLKLETTMGTKNIILPLFK